MIFSSLPVDIVHHILSYNEAVKLRNGKYMGQISKSDQRYKLLLKVRRKITKLYPNYCYIVYVSKLLIIRIYIYFYEIPLEYEYEFNRKDIISYVPFYERPHRSLPT